MNRARFRVKYAVCWESTETGPDNIRRGANKMPAELKIYNKTSNSFRVSNITDETGAPPTEITSVIATVYDGRGNVLDSVTMAEDPSALGEYIGALSPIEYDKTQNVAVQVVVVADGKTVTKQSYFTPQYLPLMDANA